MKKAVVFYGSMRELELGSKSWHILGEDVDYFLVTWDVVNTHKTDTIPPYPFDITKFPVPIVSSIIINFMDHERRLRQMGVEPCGMLHILYHWSLIRNLPNIQMYDSIIIARTDMALFKLHGKEWIPEIKSGKITLSGNDHDGVNDWLLATDLAGLDVFWHLYTGALSIRDFVKEDGSYKIIHHYLYEKVKANPDQYNWNPGSNPLMVLVRPGYPEEYKKMPYTMQYGQCMIQHYLNYEYEIRVKDPIERANLVTRQANMMYSNIFL